MLNLDSIVRKNKFLIIGAPGSGKTSLAHTLGSILGLEIFHLDSFFWKPGWEKIVRSERVKILESILEKDKWIMEGNYPDMLKLQAKFVDVIIVLEFSRRLCYWRVAKRKFKSIVKPLPDIALGCSDTLDLRFLKSIWDYPLKDSPLIEQVLKEVGEKVIIIRLSTALSVSRFIKSATSLHDTE